MRTSNDPLRQILASDADSHLPTFDDRLHERVMSALAPLPLREGKGTARQTMKRRLYLLSLPLRGRLGGGGERQFAESCRSTLAAPAQFPPEGEGQDWRFIWLAGAAGLAASIAIAALLFRSPAPPPDDLSTSFAALTTAAGPAREVAMVPIDRVHQNLSALHDDTQRLAHFVSDQLDVLPSPG